MRCAAVTPMNTSNPLSAERQVDFLLGIHRVLQEGGFSATYKYALLLSIADISVEKGDDRGGRLRITTRELALKFIDYYWRQAQPYRPGPGEEGMVLLQNKGKQARVVTVLAKTRGVAGDSLEKLMSNPAVWQSVLREVEDKVREMPLWRLQTVGGRKFEFLYANQGGGDYLIELNEGVCFCFRLFRGLIDDLVKAAWARFVVSVKENRLVLGGVSGLEDFLFGPSARSAG